jgi:NAD(P)-dependent dehydrogenase (short-subunit alcohol dehydrogenase family)
MEHNMRLHNQVAIVTGVSHAGQVGYALAAAFAREGHCLPSALAMLSASMHVRKNCALKGRALSPFRPEGSDAVQAVVLHKVLLRNSSEHEETTLTHQGRSDTDVF